MQKLKVNIGSLLSFVSWIKQLYLLWNLCGFFFTGLYRKFTSLKKQQKGTKFLLSFGGQRKAITALSSLAQANKENRWRFLNSLFRLLRKYDFDGVDFALDGLLMPTVAATKNICTLLQVLSIIIFNNLITRPTGAHIKHLCF